MLEESRRLSGRVHTVIAERARQNGVRVDEFVYDSAGRLQSYVFRGPDGYEFRRTPIYDEQGKEIRPGTQVFRRSDGSRTEVQQIKADSWSMDLLQGIGFGTHGATCVETRFRPDGTPDETIFFTDDREEISRLRYTCDEAGRVIDATQYITDSELFRAIFQYDEHGLVIEERVLFAGALTHRTVYAYNDKGDLASATVEAGGPSPHTDRFEYEYDSNGNWVRKLVHHSLGTDEIRRRITYFQ
ncbi:MAG TPA: hypothetical protein VGK64_07640 [Bryobacteraceae bacterium]